MLQPRNEIIKAYGFGACSGQFPDKVANASQSSCSFPCPWYQKVPLSLALSPRIISAVSQFKPDIIHASSPGIMVNFYCYLSFAWLLSIASFYLFTYLWTFLALSQVFGALIIAKLLSVPIVMSYHTHVPV